MRGSMNGGSRRTAAVILGLCLLTGCGAKENEAQYVQPQGLEALQVFLIAPAAAAPEEETVLPAEEPEPEQPRLPKEAEVTGAEEETLRTLIRAAEVYNSPSVEGTQIGTLKRGERVAAIGPAESAEWIKIEYNGRVAYVETEVLREQAGNTEGQSAVPGQNTGGGLNVAPTPTPTPEPTPTPTPAEQTATPTPTPPEQTPTPTPTPPEQTITPTPTPPEQTPTPTPTPPEQTITPTPTPPEQTPTPTPTPPEQTPTPTPTPPEQTVTPIPTPPEQTVTPTPTPPEQTSEPIPEPTPTPPSEPTPIPEPASEQPVPEVNI